jgi:hypothetical protein
MDLIIRLLLFKNLCLCFFFSESFVSGFLNEVLRCQPKPKGIYHFHKHQLEYYGYGNSTAITVEQYTTISLSLFTQMMRWYLIPGHDRFLSNPVHHPIYHPPVR